MNPKSEIRNSKFVLSVAFWLALLVAVAMYALVALSPKLVVYLDAKNQWRENQNRLVQLESKVNYLGRVKDALQNDPEFASELARIELNASRTGDERIPVGHALELHTADPSHTASNRQPNERWFRPQLQRFADDDELRRWLLLGAAVITMFAFTFLHDRPPRQPAETARNSWMLSRYRK